jgi:hypothetical protein
MAGKCMKGHKHKEKKTPNKQKTDTLKINVHWGEG